VLRLLPVSRLLSLWLLPQLVSALHRIPGRGLCVVDPHPDPDSRQRGVQQGE
jgi:hypothetical protein